MTAWLIAIAATAAYLAGLVIMTRWRYAATRPYTEPLNCRYRYACENGGHSSRCYQRNDSTLIESATEALVYALLLAMIWPLVVIGFGCLAAARKIAGSRELPEERAARVKRLERELGLGDRR